MTTTTTNSTDAINVGSNPAAPAISTNPSSSSPSGTGKQPKHNDKQPIVYTITADSDTALFLPRQPKIGKLDGDYNATITGVSLKEIPLSETKPKKKNGRKTKGGKGKAAAKTKPSKPGAKRVSLMFQLDKRRSDGTTYTVEKEIRAQQDLDSKFGEFMKKILTDEGTLNQFFSTYRLSVLLNRRCALKLKEVRRKGQSSIKILDVLPPQVLAPEFANSGTIDHTVEGRINESAGNAGAGPDTPQTEDHAQRSAA